MSAPELLALPPQLLRTIDPVCDAFESAWLQGSRPRIEDFVGSVTESVRPVLLAELVRIELEWRCRRGDPPIAEEYRVRFPACADIIDDWLAEARQTAETLSGVGAPDTPAPGMPALTAAFPAVPPSTVSQPSVLGEYELQERLGAGGMGEVYKARHQRLDKLVALKLLPAGAQGSADRVARFLREMRAVGSLDHPNVVEAHDAGEQAGVVYLVMKLIEGADLAKVVRQRGPLPVAEACDLARQTALGLQYLHQRGLVHRDIKPSNLMRTADGTVKILDLGLARWHVERSSADELTGTGQVLGTFEYLAPEQARNAAVNSRADLYALGGTLFFLLTGHAPFAHRNGLYEKLAAHQEEGPPDVRTLRPDVPPALAELVQRLLAKKAEDRPQTAAEVAAALAGFAKGVTPGTPVSFPPTSAPARKAHRWPWVIAGLGVPVLALGLVLAPLWRDRPERQGRPQVPPMATVPAPEKLAVLSLDVTHFENVAGRNDLPRGLLGKDSFVARLDDSVTLAATLSRPAYAYLIAFRPDGTEELCFPESEDEMATLTDRPRYPSVSRGVNYGLNEGEGLQVFALVASSRPLPAYKAWRPKCGRAPWKTFATPLGVVWWDNGGEVRPLTAEDPNGQRGKGQRVAGKTPVVELTDWLRRAPGVEVAAAVGFAVLPKKGP
jgi:serine/threonine protein kinase